MLILVHDHLGYFWERGALLKQEADIRTKGSFIRDCFGLIIQADIVRQRQVPFPVK